MRMLLAIFLTLTSLTLTVTPSIYDLFSSEIHCENDCESAFQVQHQHNDESSEQHCADCTHDHCHRCHVSQHIVLLEPANAILISSENPTLQFDNNSLFYSFSSPLLRPPII